MASNEIPSAVYDPLVFYEDPYPIYRLLRDSGAVYQSEERGVWVLSRYREVQAAARDWQTYSNAEGVDIDDFRIGPGSFLELDPPRHDELRKLVQPSFAPARIKPLEEGVHRKVDELLTPLVESGGGDLSTDFARRLPLALICDLLGIPAADHDAIDEWFTGMMERVPGQVEAPAQAEEAASSLRAYIGEAVAERHRRPRDDLLTRLASAEAAGEVSPQEVGGMVVLLLIAGIHTTSSLIATSLLVLEPLAEKRALLRSEPERIPAAIEELLRYDAPIQWLVRVTTRDVEVEDVVIPGGAKTILLWGSANRDERRFEDPDTLDFDRPRARHLAFGEGIHFCLGAPLARMEARLAFEAFFARVSDYSLAGPVERLFTFEERAIANLPASLQSA
jgi:cytochrome P450